MRARLLALLLAGPCGVLAGQASIELLPQAKVAASSVVLGDVALLHSEELALMRKLVNLPLGRAPQVGEIAQLQREALAHWVRRQIGRDAENLAWSGAPEAKVLRAPSQVSGEEVARTATESLRSELAARGQRADIQVRLAPRDLDVPAGPVRLEVRGLDRGLAHRHAVLWVDVWAADRFVRSLPVSLEIVQVGSEPAPPLEQASRTETRRPESEAPVVARGDWATLRSSDGVITVESRVEVLQDGRPGQKIRVRAQGATGPAFARVVGRGRLELLP